MVAVTTLLLLVPVLLLMLVGQGQTWRVTGCIKKQ